MISALSVLRKFRYKNTFLLIRRQS